MDDYSPMQRNHANEAVRIARSILDRTTPVLLGARKLFPLVCRLGIDREQPFVTFVAVESETDHLPVNPEERKLWNPQVLVEKDKEIARYTEWAEKMVFSACEALIRRFGEDG